MNDVIDNIGIQWSRPRRLICGVDGNRKMKVVKIYIIIFIIISFPLIDSYPENGSKTIASQEVAIKVNEIMEELEKGNFIYPKEYIVADGWIIEDSKGNKYQRSDLYYQCERIIPYGKEAVPVLLNWINHKEKHMRYICSWSLKKITGEDPRFYLHGEPGETINGNDKWFEAAIKTWREWYDNNKDN